MNKQALPQQMLFLNYDALFKAIEKAGYTLTDHKTSVTAFYKTLNQYLEGRNSPGWDRKTIKELAERTKTKMRHYNAEELCNFLGCSWFEIFATAPATPAADTGLDAHTLGLFRDRLVETVSKYEKEVLDLTAQNKQSSSALEDMTKDVLYKNEQLKQAKAKLADLAAEHEKFKKMVAEMEQTIGKLDKTADIKKKAQAALSNQDLEQAEHLLLKARATDILEFNGKKVEIFRTSAMLGDLRVQNLDYRNALTFYQEALEQLPHRIEVLNKLGTCYLHLAEYHKSLEIFKKVQKLVTEHHSDEPRYLAEVLYSLGMAYNRQGYYKKAIENYKSSLAEKYAYLEPDSLEIARNVHIIGNMEVRLENYTKACSFYQKAHKLKKLAIEGESPWLVTSLMGMGMAQCYLGNHETAEGYLNQSVDYLEANFPQSLELAYAYNNLSVLYNATDRYLQSAAIVEKALDISKKYLGDHHDNVGRFYNNIAESYYRCNRYQEAIRYFESSLEIKKGIFGEQHEVVARSILGMGDCYLKLADVEGAKALYSKSYGIYKKTLGEDSAKTLRAYGKLHSIAG